MKVAAGEYVLVKGIGNSDKPKLVKFLEQDGKECTGYLDIPLKEDDSKTASFLISDVICNLGKYPKAGQLYGVKIEPLRKTINHKYFGEIRIYHKLDDEKVERLLHELKLFYSYLKQHGHLGIGYDIEVRNPQGKYEGYYKYMPKADRDILCVKPESGLEGMQQILSHEHGHGMWHHRLTARLRNRWIKLYHTYVALMEATEDDLQQILDEIIAMGSIGDYLKDAEPDTKDIIKACLRYIGQVHGLNKHHLETALSIQESIEDYWPTSSIDFSTKEVIITDYARKSPEELFAETYSFWFLNRPLPKKVDNLLNDTLSKLVK